MTTTRKPTFTNAPFVRSHGRNPSGRGGWAFQASTTSTAFDRDLVGEVVFAPGGLTLTEAKRWAAEELFGAKFVAVLP